jgi:hypothetical protein
LLSPASYEPLPSSSQAPSPLQSQVSPLSDVTMSPGDRSQQIQASAIFFLLLSWLFVSARCYVKLFMRGKFGFEDSLLVFTLVRLVLLPLLG